MLEDAELLRRYARDRSEPAFAELVRRYLDLVYSVALRQVGGDAHMAEDVAQQVFAALARKAAALADRPAVSGWLYRSTHFAASDAVRGERRRRRREQEAQRMNLEEFNGSEGRLSEGSHADWDRVRPAIDAAIAELNERDRDAVSLRFFEGRSFADVGSRLHLSENAARMRVERALDKLHVALTRRGVRSTAAALGLALGQQAALAAPPALAGTVTAAAVAGAAAGASGVVAFLAGSKLLTTLGTASVAGALTVAAVQYQRSQDTATALAAAERRQQTLRVEVDALNTRLRQAEQRAIDADRDSAELLAAVQAVRPPPGTPPPTRGTPVLAAPGTVTEEDDRLLQERAYQQALARRRAEEAMARAKLDEEARDIADAATRFWRLIQEVELQVARKEFQLAIRLFNQAMQSKPAGLEFDDRLRALQTQLAAQNAPVEVKLVSDSQTWVSITHLRAPEKFQTATVRLLPGDYVIVGRRKGYRDVTLPLVVRAGVPPPPITVICTESVGR